MFEEKESFWKKKGFYLAVCTALVCVLGIGTVYYRMNYKVIMVKTFLQILQHLNLLQLAGLQEAQLLVAIIMWQVKAALSQM